MILIPNKKKQFLQPNNSDFSGNVWASKNINFDENGYLKLSSRAVSILSVEDDSHLGYPFSIGRKDLSGNFLLVTSDYPFLGLVADTGISVTEEATGANIPVGSLYNRGTWWQNKWHVVNKKLGIKTKDSAGTWATALADGADSLYPHPIEVFRDRNTLVIGDRNMVRQYESDYSTSTNQLTLPIDFNVTDIAWSGNNVGIATVIDSSLAGQNQEAVFFIWNGASTDAQSGYPVGSDAILEVKAYLSSYVILTRSGKIKFFNGGGFKDLATLPYWFKKYSIDASLALGDIMTIQDDLIYINVQANINYFGKKQEKYMQNFTGGILCYDPAVGLYHRYSPSISKLSSLTITGADIATGILTASAGTLPATGGEIMYTSDPANLIGGLTVGTLYYIIKLSSTTFKLATTKANALAGTFITLTSDHSGTFFALDLVDYGASISEGVNGIAQIGNQAQIYNHLIFGGYYKNKSLTPKQTVNITVPQFENRGYIITPKIFSQNIEDNVAGIYCKFKPLKTYDKILFKIRNDEVLGLPVTTGQRGKDCTWSSSTVFTTTADISEAMNYLNAGGTNALECEVIAGAGAGQMEQISSITYSAGTYTVTLAVAMNGVVNTNKSDVIIDCWKYFDVIDNTETKTWKWISIDKAAKSSNIKVELRGDNTTIEELQIINKTQIPST